MFKVIRLKASNSSGLKQIKNIEKPERLGPYRRITLMDKVLMSAFHKDKMNLTDIYESNSAFG